jgi:serine/threonine protein kinase
VKKCEAEISNLQRFVDQDHDHLIRLLCTFQHKERFHLIFPWADANLQDFWLKKYPDAETPPRDYSLARWVSQEILGLAEGLQMIHGSDIPGSTEQSLGRHGDLKPENILWFKGCGHDDSRYPTGVLQICDFGLTDFHSKQSVALVAAESIGGTQTYRAPECHTQNYISQSYDIWSLGCVLLELVTWYMLGAEGLDDFLDKRIAGSPEVAHRTKEDTFFCWDKHPSWRGSRVTKKKAVKKVSLLQSPNEARKLIPFRTN